jgi:hypothetical protein
MSKVLAALATLLLVLCVAVFAYEVYTLVRGIKADKTPLPGWFGNTEGVRALLKKDAPKKEFSFAVAGDSRTYTPFQRICEELRTEPISFMVNLGDTSRHPTLGSHQYLNVHLTEKTSLPFPEFYVMGNHDVAPNLFSMDQWEKKYGPALFSFDYNGCLFIFLRVYGEGDNWKESLAYLESQLSRRSPDISRTFIFSHSPLMAQGSSLPPEGISAFTGLCDRYKVDYAISGHMHGYARKQINNTVYLISGGGGAHLVKEKFGMFHHSVVITVKPDGISEDILYVDGDMPLGDNLDRWAISSVFPTIREHPIPTGAVNVGLLALAWLAIRLFVRSRKTARRSVAESS